MAPEKREFGDLENLDRLQARIDAAKKPEREVARQSGHLDQTGAAWRMVIELVVGLAMGFGIGYGLDSVFDTLPIFLVLFTLLGFAAGVRVMMQSAKELQDAHVRDQIGAQGKDETPGNGPKE